jgi:hypothetical protein
VEEFFNADPALGWDRAGAQNFNMRYGPMTMALLAQAVIHPSRQRLGEPFQSGDAPHRADGVCRGLQGDIRVRADTIALTSSNAPNAELLRMPYEGLPAKRAAAGINPRVPWWYDVKLDFRFR